MVSVCSLTLSERIRFQSCSLPVLGRTSCYSLFSSREVLGSLSKQSCHVANLTEISVLCEVLVVTKIAWLLCAARGVRVTHGTWCREAAEVRMFQGPGNRQRRPPAQRGRPWVSVQTAQAICTALRASQCAWKDTLPSGEQDGASPCLAVQPSAEMCCTGVSGACQDVWPPLRLQSYVWSLPTAAHLSASPWPRPLSGVLHPCEPDRDLPQPCAGLLEASASGGTTCGHSDFLPGLG